MVAGHLQEKKGYYYAVLSYKDADKRRRTKWIASGLPVKGNKKKAEGFLQEQRRSFEIPLADQPIAKDGQELFADYLQRWLQVAKTTVAPTTYGSYGGWAKAPTGSTKSPARHPTRTIRSRFRAARKRAATTPRWVTTISRVSSTTAVCSASRGV